MADSAGPAQPVIDLTDNDDKVQNPSTNPNLPIIDDNINRALSAFKTGQLEDILKMTKSVSVPQVGEAKSLEVIETASTPTATSSTNRQTSFTSFLPDSYIENSFKNLANKNRPQTESEKSFNSNLAVAASAMHHLKDIQSFSTLTNSSNPQKIGPKSDLNSKLLSAQSKMTNLTNNLSMAKLRRGNSKSTSSSSAGLISSDIQVIDETYVTSSSPYAINSLSPTSENPKNRRLSGYTRENNDEDYEKDPFLWERDRWPTTQPYLSATANIRPHRTYVGLDNYSPTNYPNCHVIYDVNNKDYDKNGLFIKEKFCHRYKKANQKSNPIPGVLDFQVIYLSDTVSKEKVTNIDLTEADETEKGNEDAPYYGDGTRNPPPATESIKMSREIRAVFCSKPLLSLTNKQFNRRNFQKGCRCLLPTSLDERTVTAVLEYIHGKNFIGKDIFFDIRVDKTNAWRGGALYDKDFGRVLNSYTVLCYFGIEEYFNNIFPYVHLHETSKTEIYHQAKKLPGPNFINDSKRELTINDFPKQSTRVEQEMNGTFLPQEKIQHMSNKERAELFVARNNGHSQLGWPSTERRGRILM